MIPAKNSILVRVDLSQNEEANYLKTGKGYNENFRERNPVIAKVEQGTLEIPTGSYIVCNYSHFDLESPLQMFDDVFSVPIDSEIFAIINEDGTLTPINGNLLVERITKETKIELPEELKKPYMDRGVLITPTENIKSGSFVFWLKMADYQIVYIWEGEEKRALKIHESEIVGYLKN